jgi:hypothetical protein
MDLCVHFSKFNDLVLHFDHMRKELNEDNIIILQYSTAVA